MSATRQVTLRRTCEAIQIPAGYKVILPAGSVVTITQALGGTYTVLTDQGLFRIAGRDADDLREETTAEVECPTTAAIEVPVEKLVWDQLKTCFDPEIPVNIVDLGLVYRCQITLLPEGGYAVEVTMTLTAPGCGMGDVLKADVQEKLLSVPGVEDVNVTVVIDPPWNPNRMSEAARLQLGMQ